jgi:hypothetical protein
LSLGIIGECKLPPTTTNANGFLLEKDGFNCHIKALSHIRKAPVGRQRFIDFQ